MARSASARRSVVVVAAVLAAASLGCRKRSGADSAPTASPADATAPPPSAAAAPPPSAPAPPSDAPFFIPDPTQKVVPILRPDAPSYRYSRLDRVTCEAELTRRGVPFARGEPTEGVLAPVRLRGPLHGVSIHTARPVKEREKSIYEIFDCRLVLAIDDFSAMVAQRDVVEIIHYNAYRPKTQNGCTARYWGLQHCGALAVDIGQLKRKDGTVLDVERDFHGKIGLGTCAAGVGPTPPTPAATTLWSFVCDSASRALFHVMLTPNYNREHKNHFHLEITPDAGWMMVK